MVGAATPRTGGHNGDDPTTVLVVCVGCGRRAWVEVDDDEVLSEGFAAHFRCPDCLDADIDGLRPDP